MNVSLTVLSSISCIFDVELFTYVKEQKAVLEFFVPREKRSFFYSSFFMLEMSKGGMNRFLLKVELEKTKIKCHGILSNSGKKVYPVQMS